MEGLWSFFLIMSLNQMLHLTPPLLLCDNLYNLTPFLSNFKQFKHQSTITVNEEGTQAAAVTTVGFMPLSTQVRFTVDRPFLFLVYEHRTSCLLFMGRVANPAKS